ncbi:MAG: SH3 domain-containing protein [Burkholderiaceae bacterium]
MSGSGSILRFFLAVFFLAGAGVAIAAQMVSVDRDEINMRTGPGIQYDAVFGLPRGYPLQVITRRGEWFMVRDFENDVGWVYGPLTSRRPHVVVKVERLNIRKAPGTGNRVIAVARAGEVLGTLAHRSGWVRVKRADGVIGWVSRRLVWGW